MLIPEPLPPLPYLPDEMQELVERYEALRQREGEARKAIPQARQAVHAAEEEDRRAQAEAIRDGGTVRDVGWSNRDAAVEALADAEAEHDAVYSLIRQFKREWVDGIREHLPELLDRAAAEAERSAAEYQAAIDAMLAMRPAYKVATTWLGILQRFADDDDGQALRWPGEQSAIGGEIRFRGRANGETPFNAQDLPAMLHADATRHVPAEPRQRTVGDEQLTADLRSAVDGRPTGTASVHRKTAVG